jgi:hypothetical protein
MRTNLHKATSEAHIFKTLLLFIFGVVTMVGYQSGRIEHQACSLTIRRHQWLPEEGYTASTLISCGYMRCMLKNAKCPALRSQDE